MSRQGDTWRHNRPSVGGKPDDKRRHQRTKPFTQIYKNSQQNIITRSSILSFQVQCRDFKSFQVSIMLRNVLIKRGPWDDITHDHETSWYINAFRITGHLWGESAGNRESTGDHDITLIKGPGGRFKNTYELLNLRALKISKLHKNHIFQCMGKIFCVEFQRVPLKFHTKYLTHT